MRILIIEDDPAIATNLYDFLSARGHCVDAAGDGVTGLHLAVREPFDAIVLDIGLPGMDGIKLCDKLRNEAHVPTPVLILTARDTLNDKLQGFGCGADDYLVKPFALKEVEARLLALHKRSTGRVTSKPLVVGALSLDPRTLEIRFSGTEVKLTPKCMRLLELLMSEPGRVFSRAHLESAVWGEAQETSDTLRSHMHVLRRTLVESGGYDPIETVHGLGYRMTPHAPSGKLNLRLRIAAVLATVCIAAVAALGITLYMASKDMEQELVEQLVTEELEALIERARGDAPHVFTGGPHFQYYVLNGPAQRDELPAALRNLGVGHHTVGVGPEEVHVAIRDTGERRYVVAYDAGPHGIREARFRNLLLFSLLTAAAVAVVLGYSLAGVLTRQLDDLASRVAGLAPHEPHPPLERADHDDEVAALAHALDEYHVRMIDMMRREQEFSANASHELRTPLTAIRTSCELLAADEGLSGKSHARVEMIDNAARQMTERIESLPLLARQRTPESLENVALRHCVDDAASPYKDEMNRKGLAFEVRIPDDAVLRLDRKALQLVLANLIKNAVVYTERGYVRVSYEGQRLTVSDSGPGIAPQHREQVFERYYRADRKPEGLGLGLAIVRRICEDLGWKIEVQSNPGGGVDVQRCVLVTTVGEG